MAEGSDYRSHLSLEAAAFLVSLPRRQQKRVLDLADQIARLLEVAKRRAGLDRPRDVLSTKAFRRRMPGQMELF